MTWTWVTDHSHCRSGTGRTPDAGCDLESWSEGPDRSLERPEGPAGCSWRGHSPHQNCQREGKTNQIFPFITA